MRDPLPRRGAGLLGLFLASTSLHAPLGEIGEKAVTLVAASVLGAAHWRNYRLCRADRCEHASG